MDRRGSSRACRSRPSSLPPDRRACLKQVARILRKSERLRSAEERAVLARAGAEVGEVRARLRRRQRAAERAREREDAADVLRDKCAALAAALQRARHLVVYTGAGISTAADIPDYRGPDGIWTRLQQGRHIGEHDLSLAKPTYTHMALRELHRRRILKFVVSQNCDGLHLRSGLPRRALAEVHGNMYVEVCAWCRPCVPYLRLFDTTERTARYSHATRRICHYCTRCLTDTIVHFGERGKMAWPLNWSGALRHAASADVILCLGSSLKVLRRYPWLWAMHRPAARRPRLFIVNLQWTPKDEQAELKINGRCDDVMRQVMAHLGLVAPPYRRAADPLFAHATPLSPRELHTTSRAMLRRADTSDSDDDRPLTLLKRELSGASPRPKCNGHHNTPSRVDDKTLMGNVINGGDKLDLQKENSISKLMKKLNGFNESKSNIDECKCKLNKPKERDKHKTKYSHETREEIDEDKYEVKKVKERDKHKTGYAPEARKDMDECKYEVNKAKERDKHKSECAPETREGINECKYGVNKTKERDRNKTGCAHETKEEIDECNNEANKPKEKDNHRAEFAHKTREEIYECIYGVKNPKERDKHKAGCVHKSKEEIDKCKYEVNKLKERDNHNVECAHKTKEKIDEYKYEVNNPKERDKCKVECVHETREETHKFNVTLESERISIILLRRHVTPHPPYPPHLTSTQLLCAPTAFSAVCHNSCLIPKHNSLHSKNNDSCLTLRTKSCNTTKIKSSQIKQLVRDPPLMQLKSIPTLNKTSYLNTQLNSTQIIDKSFLKLNSFASENRNTVSTTDKDFYPTCNSNSCLPTKFNSCPLVNHNGCPANKLNSCYSTQFHSGPIVNKNSPTKKLNHCSVRQLNSYPMVDHISCPTEQLNQCPNKLDSCSATELNSCPTEKLNMLPMTLDSLSPTQLHSGPIVDQKSAPTKKCNPCPATQINLCPAEQQNVYSVTQLHPGPSVHRSSSLKKLNPLPITKLEQQEPVSGVRASPPLLARARPTLRSFRMAKRTPIPVCAVADASDGETDAWSARVAAAAVTRALAALDARLAYSGLHTILVAAPPPQPPPPPSRARKRIRRPRAHDCAFCQRHYATSRCAFYPPHDPDAREQRRVRGGALRMCDCCGHSDSECEGGAAGARGPGWYGRGYGKARRRRS